MRVAPRGRRRFGGTVAALIVGGCAGEAEPAPSPPHPYSLAGTLEQPVVFAIGAVSGPAPEFATAFSPDGRTVYFSTGSSDRASLWIAESRFEGDDWTPPVPVAFTGRHRDVDPFVTPDGEPMYFSSDSPTDADDTLHDFNTGFVVRQGDGWSEPRVLPPPINTDSAEVFVSTDRNGTLHFASNRDGTFRIYRTSLGAETAPELLDFELNLGPGANNPLIAPHGRFLLFAADHESGYGGADLFVIERLDSRWGEARNLGPVVNSQHADFAPALSPDGRYLFFTSERPGVAPLVPDHERRRATYISCRSTSSACRETPRRRRCRLPGTSERGRRHMSVKHADSIPATAVSAGSGTTRQVLIGPDEAPNFAMRRFVMQPGGGMPPHTNSVEHEQFVLRGRARIGIGDEEVRVAAGDAVYIPAGTPHWYAAEGDEPFEFLCVVPNGPDRITLVDR